MSSYNNREWISNLDYQHLDSITRKTLNKYKPFVLSNNYELVSFNTTVNNENRKKINSLLREGDIMIGELIETKEKLQKQKDNIDDILGEHLNIEEYVQFLKDSSIKTDKFIFTNIDGMVGTISKNIGKVEDNVDYIKYSIDSAMSWKYIDLTKHAIGTLDDLMAIAVELLINEDVKNLKLNDVDKTGMIRKVFGIYIEKRDEADFFNRLTYEGFHIPRGDEDKKIIMFDENITSNSALIDSRSYTKSITNKINRAIEAAKSIEGGVKTGVAREFLIVIVDYLMGNVVDFVGKTVEEFDRFQKIRYDNKYSKIVKNMMTNYEMFIKLIENVINKYFDLDNKDISAYGIGQATLDKNAKPSFVERGTAIRVVGGWDRIRGIDKFDDYVLSGSKGEMVKKLVKMFSYAPKIDIADNETILAMGGFILKESIGKMSIKIVRDYFEKLIKNKEANLKYVDKILDGMRKGVHISDLKKMREKIENKIKEIGNVSERLPKVLRAKAAYKVLMDDYMKIRTNEMDSLLSLDLIQSSIRNNPNKLDKLGKKMFRTRDEIIIKFGHYQLKSNAFKVLAYGIYKDLMRSNSRKYPDELFILLQDEFAVADNRLMKEFQEKAKDRYEDLRKKLVSKNLDIKLPKINNKNIVATKYDNHRLSYSKLIETSEYWANVKRNLGGLTIYIPYVSTFTNQHGLFDLLDSAMLGKIGEYIDGSKLDVKILSQNISKKGIIMVADNDSDVRDPRTWRCISTSEINKMGQLSAADFRKKIFNIISSKMAYQNSASYLWPDSSNTKQKIMDYCRTAYGSNSYDRCIIISSRNRIVDKIMV